MRRTAVHHINGNRYDNREENLMIVPSDEHARVPLRVGAYVVEERRRKEKIELTVRREDDMCIPRIVLISRRAVGDGWEVTLRLGPPLVDPDLVECLGLALDRAAEILRGAE